MIAVLHLRIVVSAKRHIGADTAEIAFKKARRIAQRFRFVCADGNGFSVFSAQALYLVNFVFIIEADGQNIALNFFRLKEGNAFYFGRHVNPHVAVKRNDIRRRAEVGINVFLALAEGDLRDSLV